jgi:undecaprenyl-diphosphatase
MVPPPADDQFISGIHVRSKPSRPLIWLLVMGMLMILLTWGFAQLGGEVYEGDTRSFDMFFLRQAQALRISQPWAADTMRDLSGLGSTTVLSLFTVITVLYLLLVGERPIAILVTGAVTSGTAVVNVLKDNFGRIRPDPDLAEIVVTGLSFPSGHASLSAVVFLTLGVLAAQTRARPVEQAYILAVAAAVTCLVGISRVALGVHWATDVLAGWAFGTAWAMVWLLLARGFSPSGD